MEHANNHTHPHPGSKLCLFQLRGKLGTCPLRGKMLFRLLHVHNYQARLLVHPFEMHGCDWPLIGPQVPDDKRGIPFSV